MWLNVVCEVTYAKLLMLRQQSRVTSRHLQQRTQTQNAQLTKQKNLLLSSVVDPNTFNLDPDPCFWPN